MEKKAPKVLFYLSFLSWAFVLLYGLYGAIFGLTFFTMCYGWDGFLVGVMGGGLAHCIVPVLPVCLVYEIAYLLRKVPAMKKVPLKTYIIGSIVVGTILTLVALVMIL